MRSPEPGAEHGAAVAAGEVAEAGDSEQPAIRFEDPELQPLAALALAVERLDERDRLALVRVRPPGEETRHVRVTAELKESARVIGAEDLQGEARPADDHYSR